jgi:hypothetical protein
MVPNVSDRTPVLPESLACEVAGLAPSKRRDWVKRGLLRQPLKGARLRDLHVIELAVVRELHDVLGPRDAGLAWREVREQFRDTVPSSGLAIVVDLGYREAVLVSTDEELVRAVSTTRPVQVIPLGELIERVRAAVTRLGKTARAPSRRARSSGSRSTSRTRPG